MTRTSHLTTAAMLGLAACHSSELTPADGADAGSKQVLPKDPAEFRVQLAGGPCFGSCPTYEVSINQDGDVNLFGEHCTPRPGVFAQEIAAEDARAVYDALLATRYASLGDHYRTMADGCETVFTDGPTYDWSVSADGKEKVDAVMALLLERSDALRFIEDDVFNCDRGSAAISDMSLRLSHAGAPLAMVKITKAENTWSGRFVIEDCAGHELARGEPILESRRWLLIDERRLPIALPAGLGDAGSVVLARWPVDGSANSNGPFKTTRARAFLVNGEIDFSFEEAASCAE